MSDINEEQKKQLNDALVASALGKTYTETVVKVEKDKRGQTKSQVATKTEKEVPPNPALILKLLDDGHRIGGPQDYC